MDLRNWEMYAGSGNPLVGATVKLYTALTSHPNGGAVSQQTTTDANGMWQFTGLTAGDYDVKVELPGTGQAKWYKGLVRLGISQLHAVQNWVELLGQGSAPAAPPASTGRIYFDGVDGKVKYRWSGGGVVAMADFLGATGVLGSGGWTNAPTVTGALSANSVNVNSAGAAAGEVKANSHLLSGGKVLLAGSATLGHAVPYNATLVVDTSTIIGSNVTHGLIYVFNASTGAQFFGMLDGGTSQPQNILTNGAAQWSIGADVAAGSGKIAFYWDGTNYILKNRWSGGTSIALVAMLTGRV